MGAFCWYVLGPLNLLKGRFTLWEGYHMIKFFYNPVESGLFQDDNASIHSAHMLWPSKSPDLNPVDSQLLEIVDLHVSSLHYYHPNTTEGISFGVTMCHPLINFHFMLFCVEAINIKCRRCDFRFI